MDARLMVGLVICWVVLSPIAGVFVGFLIGRAERLNRPRTTEAAPNANSGPTAFNFDDIDNPTPSIFQSYDDDKKKGTMPMIVVSLPIASTPSRQRH